MERTDLIRNQLEEASSVLSDFAQSDECIEAVSTAAQVMIQSIIGGRKIISCGNGGSMCDAMHFAEELTGRFRENRKSLPAISISDPSFLTCAGNDFGFDHVFSRFIDGVGQAGDVLVAISTSGNSNNVVLACQAAKSKGMTVVGLTGKDGGEMAELCDVEVRVPWTGYADRIQEIHIKVIHSLILCIEQGLSE